MIHLIEHTIIDTLKLVPFLFVVFLLMEFIEHKITDKNKKVITKAGRFGPVIGSILGAFPQCGFSVAATNLFSTRVITLGTLISIYLSTSDEMLPILISQNVDITVILKILAIKVVIGMMCGIVIDFIFKKDNKDTIEEVCVHEHCGCKQSIFKSSVKHTLNITLFLFVMTLILNILIHYIGEENIAKLFLKDSIFSPFISSLIGLIPNCASSVIITELYLNSAITFGSMISGLLTGSGIAIMVLFKVNKNKFENIKILSIIYIIGVISGIIIDLLGVVF